MQGEKIEEFVEGEEKREFECGKRMELRWTLRTGPLVLRNPHLRSRLSFSNLSIDVKYVHSLYEKQARINLERMCHGADSVSILIVN